MFPIRALSSFLSGSWLTSHKRVRSSEDDPSSPMAKVARTEGSSGEEEKDPVDQEESSDTGSARGTSDQESGANTPVHYPVDAPASPQRKTSSSAGDEQAEGVKEMMGDPKGKFVGKGQDVPDQPQFPPPYPIPDSTSILPQTSSTLMDPTMVMEVNPPPLPVKHQGKKVRMTSKARSSSSRTMKDTIDFSQETSTSSSASIISTPESIHSSSSPSRARDKDKEKAKGEPHSPIHQDPSSSIIPIDETSSSSRTRPSRPLRKVNTRASGVRARSFISLDPSRAPPGSLHQNRLHLAQIMGRHMIQLWKEDPSRHPPHQAPITGPLPALACQEAVRQAMLALEALLPQAQALHRSRWWRQPAGVKIDPQTLLQAARLLNLPPRVISATLDRVSQAYPMHFLSREETEEGDEEEEGGEKEGDEGEEEEESF